VAAVNTTTQEETKMAEVKELQVGFRKTVSDGNYGTCEACGKSFALPPARAARSEARFCSWQCRYPPLEERFWSKVAGSDEPDGCWFWTGARDKDGYGLVTVDGKLRRACRVAYELVYGPLAVGEQACHECDANYPPGDTRYRGCVRPDHLFAGTNAENHTDKRVKGRAPSGERNGRAKLTQAKADEIRERYARGGETCRGLAHTYGVDRAQIAKVLSGRRWMRREVAA
jgi:hypothetical protein